jgi:hypothetical protein
VLVEDLPRILYASVLRLHLVCSAHEGHRRRRFQARDCSLLPHYQNHCSRACHARACSFHVLPRVSCTQSDSTGPVSSTGLLPFQTYKNIFIATYQASPIEQVRSTTTSISNWIPGLDRHSTPLIATPRAPETAHIGRHGVELVADPLLLLLPLLAIATPTDTRRSRSTARALPTRRSPSPGRPCPTKQQPFERTSPSEYYQGDLDSSHVGMLADATHEPTHTI